uniref:Down syndrome cell adhesion molecule-like protein Dscam2 n=1 Tax=Strigamia maritima TaxID=126957 RepID=T1JCP3_STRMM
MFRSFNTIFTTLILFFLTGNSTVDPMGPVFIYQPPNSVDFSNSTGASVECSAHGNPLPVVQWIHAATSLPVTNVSQLRLVLPNATLVFPPFGADHYQAEVHSSVYRCRAANLHGTIISRAVQVRAVVLQAYDAQVYDEYVIRENTAVLKCQIPSFVADYVTVTSWVRNSMDNIETDVKKDSKFFVLPSGELYIHNVSAQDALHTYHCRTLHWLSGEAKLSATAGKLVVTDPNGSVPPRITDGKSIVQAKEREMVVLACAAQGHPAPSYSWHHKVDSGQQVTAISESRLHQVHGLLIIDHVQPEDAGTFVCSASNSLGTERIETSLIVNVPLSVHIEPVQQILDRGRMATFTCVISGHPISSVIWLKDGRDVKKENILRRDMLQIERVHREDSGMYQCFVTNNVETVQSTAELRLGDSLPEILSAFKSHTLNPGVSLSLRCVAAGIPVPKVIWNVDDTLVNPGDRIRVGEYNDMNGNVISHVNISRVQVEDGGLFACTASNKAGNTTHTAPIAVYGNPYIRSMPKITVVAGEDLRMRCPVSGHPIDSIYWEIDGSRLPVNHRQKSFHNGTILVQSVQRNLDAGKYTCVASNNQGNTARRDFEVAVLVPPKIIPFSFQEDQTYEGVRASVFCSSSQGDLPLNIKWYKDNTLVQPKSDVTTQTIDNYASTLVIELVKAHHSGNYTCSASNAAATVNHTALLIVKVPPRWHVEPVDTSTALGSAVQIECQAEGHPPPLISWFKSLDVSSSDFVELTATSLSHQGSLRISSALEYDEGHYMCKATNNVGAGLSKVVFLNVHVPAKIDVKLKNESVKMGEEAKLRCNVHGDLPIQVTWSSSKHAISTDKRFSAEDLKSDVGMTSMLKIMNVVRKDSTMYKCNAKNQFGEDEASVLLIVQELPEAPNNIHLVEEGSRAVHISWSRPFDGNIPVTGYLVQFTSGSDWSSHVFNLTIPSTQMRVTIKDLKPATKYRFRVFATNELGMSESSVLVSTTTGEEAPSGPPKDVRVEAMNSQTLRITWKPPKQEHWNGEILGYHVGYKLYNYSEPYNFRTGSPLNLMLTFEKLKKFTKYSIVVQAFNDHGIGPNSEEVVAMTIEDVPSSSPGNVKCSAVSSQSLHIQWDPPPTHDINGLLQGYKVLYKPMREWYGGYTVCCIAASRGGSVFETKITPALKTMLHGLEKHTNYSVHLLAFTHVGDGVKSEPVFFPGPPADIKALTMSLDAILVSWLPPVKPNGNILKYTVYVRLTDSGREETTKVSVPDSMLRYESKGLSKNRRYEFWVTASTAIGEGESTRVTTQTTSGPLVSARIASFGNHVIVSWKQKLELPCDFIGTPAATVRWLFLGETLQTSNKLHVLSEGKLIIKGIQSNDAGNYTCTVQNSLNSDNITHVVVVEVPPEAPIVSIVSTTMKSIHLSWTRPLDEMRSNDIHYILSFRQDYGQWSELNLQPSVYTHTLQSLTCGTRYQVYVTPVNRIGRGQASDIITAKTKGDAPKTPSKDKLIITNSTFIILNLDSWFDGGCPILYFVVEYKRKETSDWTLVSNNVKPDNKRFVITDLAPAEAYQLRVTAHSSAGSNFAQYDFMTLIEETDDNRRHREISMQEEEGSLSFLDLSIMIPAVASIFLVAALISIVCICLKRRKMESGNTADKINPKYQSVNPDTMKKKTYTETVPTIENGSLQDTKIQENVTPYATFQILNSSQGIIPAYPSNATELNYNSKYPPAENLYNENLKQAVHMCPRHQISHTEAEGVPDLLEHGPDSSSSEDASPQFHHRTRRVDSYPRHPGDPHPLGYPHHTLNRNSRYNTAETTFIFPRRSEEMCLRGDEVVDYSQMDRNRMNLYKHKDSSPMKIMKLY